MTAKNGETEREKLFNAVLGYQKVQLLWWKIPHLHALNCIRSLSTVYSTSLLVLKCFSQHILFKSDRTDKNMTLLPKGKSCIVNQVRCLSLAETVQTINDQKDCECNQIGN